MTNCSLCIGRVWPWQKRHIKPREPQPQSMYDSFGHHDQFWKYINTPSIYHQKCWDRSRAEFAEKMRLEEIDFKNGKRARLRDGLMEKA